MSSVDVYGPGSVSNELDFTVDGPDPRITQESPFMEVYVRDRPLGGSIVYWGLKRTFAGKGPYGFTVEWAEAPDGDWEPVAQVVDTYFAMDTEPRIRAKGKETYYRVKIAYTTHCGDPAEAVAPAQQGFGVWTKRDWLIAREIARKELLVQKRYAGWFGWVLKRKVWGTSCPTCGDWDTQEAGHGKCPICFGTGKTGGYWPGHEVYGYQTTQIGGGSDKKLDDNLGMRNDLTITLRMLAYPGLENYDVFVKEDTDQRFVVRKVDVIAEVKGIPLVYMVSLIEAPATDAVYHVPVFPVPPAAPVYTDAPEAIYTGEFLKVGSHPTISISSTEEPEPEAPAPEEPEDNSLDLVVETGVLYAVWFSSATSQWSLGVDVGDEDNVLYRTTDGTSNPFFMSAYTWDTAGVTGTVAGDILTVVVPHTPAAGTYQRAGTYNSTYVYLQTV